MTNRVDVAALRARYNAIKRDALSKTDYPWRVNDDPDGFVRVHQGYAFECRLIADTMRQPVAEFLVAMHNAAPALLDEVERLRAEVEAHRRLRTDKYRDWCSAGGRVDNQCKHGVDTTRFNCRRCDESLVDAALTAQEQR